jgi:hypothetical protein
MARHAGAVTRQGRAWKLSTAQSAGDKTWVNDIRPFSARAERDVNIINIPNTGRKVRVLKSGKRRISYS